MSRRILTKLTSFTPRDIPVLNNILQELADDNPSIYNKYDNSVTYTGDIIYEGTMTAAGADTQVQYNDGGVLNASSKFTFNKTTGDVTLFAGAKLVFDGA